MKKIARRSDCAISTMLDILGDKWTLLIIRDIMFKGKNTYGDFLNSKEKIATNILADRLSRLESAGIITKQEHPESKLKYLYKLTQKGIDLMPILLEIVTWSDKYYEISDRGKIFAEKIRKDRKGLIKTITTEILKTE